MPSSSRWSASRCARRSAAERKRDASVPLKGRGLLIGIRGYVREPLKNTVHDATDIAATLDGIGFDEVKLLTDDNGADISLQGLRDAIQDFVDSVDEKSLKRGVVYGSVVASFTCEGFGTDRLVSVSRSEVEDRFSGFCESLAIGNSRATVPETPR